MFPEEGAGGDALDASLDRHVVSLCQVTESLYARISAADPGSGDFLTPGSRIPDPKPIILID